MRKTFVLSILVISLFSLFACTNKRNGAETNAITIDDFTYTNEVDKYQINTYYLDLSLDEQTDQLSVAGEIIYVNEDNDFSELYLTLYANAMNPNSSSEHNCEFEYIKVNGVNVIYDFEGEDDTLVHLTLSEPLTKDTNILIEFEYNLHYWPSDRLMATDGYYMTMFFYPYVTIYDNGEWQHEPYTFSGESYYNEIGDYYITLDVPSTYKVASSGKELFEEIDELRTLHYLFLDNGRDFSFSASDYYVIDERLIEGRTYKIVSTRELSDIEIENTYTYLEESFNFFEEAIGIYDYDYFTLEYGKIYGMESSGIVYCSSNIQEGTVVHEVLHQWFYSMIGNNQAIHSFLDESLTTFLVGTYYLNVYNESAMNQYYEVRTSDKDRYETYYNQSLGESLIQSVEDLQPNYAFLIYYHGVSIFHEYVTNFLGGDFDLFLDMIKQYYDEYHGEIVSIEQFLLSLDNYSNLEGTYEWFYNQIYDMQDLRK